MDRVLPNNWCLTTLENVASWGSGGTPSRAVASYFQGNIPWIKTGELDSKFIHRSEEHISEEAIKKSSAKIFPKGSVGIAMYGATIGKLSIFGVDASTNQACAVGVTSEAIYNEFLYYFLFAERRELIKAGKGGAQPNLSQGVIKEWQINLPPLSEQHRIVAKIEELFSELDKGIENLKTAQAQLKVYRQALLKHAFEGKLTEQWREQNKDKLETAAVLQKRIQTERAARFQHQLNDWQASGQKGSKPKVLKQILPISQEELAELPKLNEFWRWVRLEDITIKITDGDHQAPPQTKIGVPFITISDIKNQKIDFSDTRFVSKEYFDGLAENRKPVKDDILYTVTGSFGIPCLLDFDKDFCFQRHIGLMKAENSIIIKFLYYLLSSRFVYLQAVKVATGTAQKTVPLGGLRLFKVPLVAISEQQKIVEILDSKISEIEQLEQTIATSLQQSESLRQSILKKAFSGELTPQDANDEPASILLERIRKDKQQSGKGGSN